MNADQPKDFFALSIYELRQELLAAANHNVIVRRVLVQYGALDEKALAALVLVLLECKAEAERNANKLSTNNLFAPIPTTCVRRPNG